jgi:hypothetical protein
VLTVKQFKHNSAECGDKLTAQWLLQQHQVHMLAHTGVSGAAVKDGLAQCSQVVAQTAELLQQTSVAIAALAQAV